MPQSVKVAVIVGGGSGIGASTARAFKSDGFHIAILSASGKGQSIAAELGGICETGSNQSSSDVRRLLDAVEAKWGRVDVLVNSAGHGPVGSLLEITDDEWHTGMDVYLMNVIRTTRLVTPLMQRQGTGAIVNISTFAAFEPDVAFPTSSVFRAGLASFAKLFSDTYAKDRIRMNNVLPGFIDTFPEQAEFSARIPMQRYGRAMEVAQLVKFLASDDAAYITGQNIRIDGGITRSV